jgi:hypothetical protein
MILFFILFVENIRAEELNEDNCSWTKQGYP